MYTIASGKRGPAYLTKWKTLVPLNNSSSPPGGPPPVGSGGSHVIGKFGIQVANECCIDWNSGSYVFNDFTIVNRGVESGGGTAVDRYGNTILGELYEFRNSIILFSLMMMALHNNQPDCKRRSCLIIIPSNTSP